MNSTASAPTVTRVGFIGLGDMGGAMASRIVDGGFETVLWARRREALAPFAGPLVSSADNPAELAATVDLIGVCVWNDEDVRSVVAGEQGVLAGCRPGTIVAIHSTVRPDTCRELAATASDHGVIVIDAPVSGGRTVALDGKLVVAVGGTASSFERCHPVFSTFGDPLIHLGPVGTGQLAKLVNNAVFAANLAIADDAFTLANHFGIEAEAMAAMLRNGSGRSFGLEMALAGRTSADIRDPMRVPLEKDVNCLTTDVAPEECGEAPLLVEAAAEAIRRLSQPPVGWAGGSPSSTR